MNLLANIKDFIVENYLYGAGEDFNYDTPLLENGIIDSTGAMELVCFIEETFKITIEDNDLTLDNFHNLNNISRLLNTKLNQIA